LPEGFDNNDNVQVVGEGFLADGCYRYAHTTFEVLPAKKKIVLKSMAYKYSGDECITVAIPFERTVDIGILKSGNYTVTQMVNGKETTLGELSIRTALTDNPDDFLYAPVTRAAFDSGCITDHIFLQGTFPLSCMKLKDVRLTIQADVVVLQPIVEMEANVPCNKGKFPFERGVNVGFLPQGRYLAHVRSLNGKSLNELFETEN